MNPEAFPILIAEDNSADAELMELALKKAGFKGTVRFVGDGHEAVEYLKGEGPYEDRSEFPFPRVIISDLKMPRVSGLELLQWLRRHPQCHIVPLILLSGSGLEADVAAAYKLGANTYFQKPTQFQELVALLKNLGAYWAKSELPEVALA